ncbi:TPA: hypothetical protein IX405_000161 [Enterococcus faecium]|nr:hypothetical protein [Enterococcus faecium]
MKTRIKKGGLFLLGILAVLFGVWQMNTLSQEKATVRQYEQVIDKQKQMVHALQKEIDHLRNQLDTQDQKERSKKTEPSEDIAKTSARLTETLFTILYSYQSEESSVRERKEKVSKLVTSSVLEELFPGDVEKLPSTVSTVSQLDHAPIIYLDPTSKEEWKGIVLVDYSVSIAGSETQSGRFLYQVTIDPKTQQFTSILNLGEGNGY